MTPKEIYDEIEENSRPYRLRSITGDGKVAWEVSLPSYFLLMVLDENGSWNVMKPHASYGLQKAQAIATSPDSY